MTPAFTFDPLDPTEAHAVVKMCVALHGLPFPAPVIPTPGPEPLAAPPTATSPGSASPHSALPDPDANTAGSSQPAAAAGEAPSSEPSPACQPDTATAPTACGAKPSGRGTLARPAGLATFPTPAPEPKGCLATHAGRGTSREAPAPALSLDDPADDPADGPSQDGGQPRTAGAPPAAAPAEPDWAALVARVIDGRETVGDVAKSAGIVPVQRLNIRVARARQQIPKSGTPQGTDGPGSTGGGPVPAEAEAVGEDGADPIPSPTAEAPEEAEDASAPDAAADESPAAVAPIEPALADAPKCQPAAKPVPNPADVPDEEGWTPREDLKLLMLYTMGKNSYAISQILPRRNPADVVNRYRTLVPRSGIVAQREALERTKRFVTEADAASVAA